MMFAGCVIPPSLSTADAGFNSPPAITSVRNQSVPLSEGDTLQLEQGTGTFNLVVYDTDLDDTLKTKIFINYLLTDPKPARSDCTDAAGTSVARSSTCDLGGICQLADVLSKETLTMQVIVFDHDIIPGVTPLYQAMAEGGLSTSRTFFVKCQPKET